LAALSAPCQSVRELNEDYCLINLINFSTVLPWHVWPSDACSKPSLQTHLYEPYVFSQRAVCEHTCPPNAHSSRSTNIIQVLAIQVF